LGPQDWIGEFLKDFGKKLFLKAGKNGKEKI
jgi:hypothetical protein